MQHAICGLCSGSDQLGNLKHVDKVFCLDNYGQVDY